MTKVENRKDERGEGEIIEYEWTGKRLELIHGKLG